MTIENFRILDNHFHLRTDGLYLDAVKAFKKDFLKLLQSLEGQESLKTNPLGQVFPPPLED